ncbi:MAG: DsbA family protein [Geodermatophilaceae bacterium]|nr:DsbA family protein [Geodermatophilaceae bacterium]
MTTPIPGRDQPAGSKAARRRSRRQELVARKEAEAATAAKARRRRKLLTWTGVAAAMVVAVVVGLVVGSNSGDPTGDTAADTSVAAGFPASTRTDDSVVMVAADAQNPVRVELYVDLQCPACREYESRVSDTVEQLVIDGRIELLVHPIAILDRASSTQYSSRAGAAVACAADDGLYWQYQKLLYAEQPDEGGEGLTDQRLVDLGTQVGLSSGFETCVSSGAQQAWVQQVTDAAREAGISSTPTVLVAGEQITGGTAADLEAAVDAAAE